MSWKESGQGSSLPPELSTPVERCSTWLRSLTARSVTAERLYRRRLRTEMTFGYKRWLKIHLTLRCVKPGRVCSSATSPSPLRLCSHPPLSPKAPGDAFTQEQPGPAARCAVLEVSRRG